VFKYVAVFLDEISSTVYVNAVQLAEEFSYLACGNRPNNKK